MKKTILTIVVAVLCLIFKTRAQDHKAIDVTSKGIQIGQKVPDVLLNNIHNYKTSTGKLSDFKGKLIILDFWATWCNPCVAMIPKMEILQKQFEGKVQFLSVTYQKEKEVLPFLEKVQKGKPSVIPQVTGDQQLNKLFPHVYLPHYIWIDKEGTVQAITGFEEVTATHIEKALNTNSIALHQKKDMEMVYDKTRPFLINGNGGNGNNLISHSILTGYTEGLHPGYYPHKEDGAVVKISASNQSYLSLIKYAYGAGKIWIGNNRVILKVQDSSKLITQATGSSEMEWYYKNGYCYEIIAPRESPDNIYGCMQQDLKRYFPAYTAAMEKQKTKCLVLVRTSDADRLKSKGGKYEAVFDGYGCRLQNASLWELFVRLNVMYLQNSKIPLVNETGYNDKVDLVLQCNLGKIEEINQALKPYDLELITGDRVPDMLIVRDAVVNPN